MKAKYISLFFFLLVLVEKKEDKERKEKKERPKRILFLCCVHLLSLRRVRHRTRRFVCIECFNFFFLFLNLYIYNNFN